MNSTHLRLFLLNHLSLMITVSKKTQRYTKVVWELGWKGQSKRACDGEDDIPDGPPQEGIQEEEHKVHNIRDG